LIPSIIDLRARSGVPLISLILVSIQKELSQAKSDAKSYYPDFNNLPDTVQWALVDMAFNLGGAGLKKYAKLKAALEKAVQSKAKADWEAAAKESNRNGIQSSRNAAIYAWIAQGC